MSETTHRQHNIQTDFNDLVSLRQHARRLPYHAKQRGHHSLSGIRLSQPLGGGLEFDQVRLYQPGDDLSSMDWKVTARTNKPHVKEYRQERERPVVIMIDQRSSMFFGTRQAFKSVVAARLAALAAWLAIDNGERLGACVLTDDGVWQLPIKPGAQNALRLFQYLAALSPPTQFATPCPFNEALDGLKPLVRNRCLMVLLSDFAGIDETTQTKLRQWQSHCQIVASFIYDKVEKNPPPPNLYPISDGVNEAVISLADKTQQQAYQQYFVNHFQQVRKLCRQCQVPLHSIATDQDIFASPLVHWLSQVS